MLLGCGVVVWLALAVCRHASCDCDARVFYRTLPLEAWQQQQPPHSASGGPTHLCPLCGFSRELGRGMSAWVRKLNIQGLMPGGGDGNGDSNGDGDDDSDDGDVFCSPSAAAGGGEQDFELDFGATSFGSPLSAQGSAGGDSGGGL
eukprot:COSAG01_NODE_27279_length_689_cov_5.461017_1_plen_145_part_10